MKTTVSTRGQITLPAELRRQDEIEVGEEFEIERIDAGEYRLTRRKPLPNQGVVDWLLACPERGFFVPIDPTVATRNRSDFERAGVPILDPFA